MKPKIISYNNNQSAEEQKICERLMHIIDAGLPAAESKIWHSHPVWFLEDNPIVGYSKIKAGIRLMFWSGADFGEDQLEPGTGKFKDASITYTNLSQVNEEDVSRWLRHAQVIQWDYKNVVKRKGKLLRIK